MRRHPVHVGIVVVDDRVSVRGRSGLVGGNHRKAVERVGARFRRVAEAQDEFGHLDAIDVVDVEPSIGAIRTFVGLDAKQRLQLPVRESLELHHTVTGYHHQDERIVGLVGVVDDARTLAFGSVRRRELEIVPAAIEEATTEGANFEVRENEDGGVSIIIHWMIRNALLKLEGGLKW